MDRKRLLMAVIVAAFFLMASIAAYSWESIVSFSRREGAVESTYRTLAAINRLLSFLEDEESGVRGYLIAGSLSYLAPYQEAMKRVDSEMVLLEGLTRDNPREQDDLRKIASSSRIRMSYLLAVVSIRSHGGTIDPAEIRTLMDLSKEEMDRIRSLLSRVRKSEALELALRHQESTDRSKKAFRAIVLGYFAAFLMLGLAVWFLYLELLAHERSDRENRRLSMEYADLYDNAPCGYHSIDKNGLVVRINKTELSWLGHSPEEVIGKKYYHEFMTGQSKIVFEREFASFRESGAIKDIEFDFVRKDGSVFSVLSNATAFRDETGAFVLSRSVLIDITDRRKDRETILRLNEKLTERARELEALNRDLEGFTYSVSHDLRAPLRAIDGFSRILVEDYGRVLGDEGGRLLSVVRKNVQQMSALIDDLLEFSRLGKAPLDKRWIDMEALAQKAVDAVIFPSGGKTVISVSPLPRAFGDQSLLYQVWVNILSNAVKFSGNRPDPQVRVGSEKGDGEVVYFVADNGEGFDMQYYKKLFGVFQRLHSQEAFPGVGVGLAIVSRIVSRHGGRVWAHGKPGEGATFFFSLPLPLVLTFDFEAGTPDPNVLPNENKEM